MGTLVVSWKAAALNCTLAFAGVVAILAASTTGVSPHSCSIRDCLFRDSAGVVRPPTRSRSRSASRGTATTSMVNDTHTTY